ncbi:MAG: SRPBCC domain-containing protein [Saprospiraceae bacterium]|nr:SRPBCC domain-containing protein [Saprospiraceae bacterium]
MNKSLQTNHAITIHASPKKIWQVLTDPLYIAQFLYGTKTETDWKMGSPILFSGEFDGMKYNDKGIVMAVRPYTLLAYDYWTQFSGLEDLPENYCEVSYHLVDNLDGTVKFTWTQIGFANEKAMEHNKAGMPSILEHIKKIAEE